MDWLPTIPTEQGGIEAASSSEPARGIILFVKPPAAAHSDLASNRLLDHLVLPVEGALDPCRRCQWIRHSTRLRAHLVPPARFRAKSKRRHRRAWSPPDRPEISQRPVRRLDSQLIPKRASRVTRVTRSRTANQAGAAIRRRPPPQRGIDVRGTASACRFATPCSGRRARHPPPRGERLLVARSPLPQRVHAAVYRVRVRLGVACYPGSRHRRRWMRRPAARHCRPVHYEGAIALSGARTARASPCQHERSNPCRSSCRPRSRHCRSKAC